MNYTDPSGHAACDDEEGVCSGNPSKNKPSQGGLPSGNGGEDGEEDEEDLIENDHEDFTLTEEELHELKNYYANWDAGYDYLAWLATTTIVNPLLFGSLELWIMSNNNAASSIQSFFESAEQAAIENGGTITVSYYDDARNLDPKGTPGMPAVVYYGSQDFTEIWSHDLGFALKTQLEDPTMIYNNLPVYVRYRK